MTKPKPTLSDFEQVLRRRSDTAVEELGRASAAITADAAGKGALSNNRIVFRYTDALVDHWNSAATDEIEQLRRWTKATRIEGAALRTAAEQELRALIPRLIKASRAQQSTEGFANQTMLASAVQLIEGIGNDLDFRLRQFDINMDDPTAEPHRSWIRRAMSAVGNHIPEFVIGLILLVIATVLGLS